MYKPDFKELDRLDEEGYLRKVTLGDLVLYNYTDATTYEKLWNEHTLNSRGTVYDSNGNLVSLAFPKFFNLSELPEDKQKTILASKDFTVYEKLDGSYGNVFYYKDRWMVTTRGSFTSEQAIYATNNLLPKYDMSNVPKHLSFAVEIIYPSNRIIVEYGDREELVTLAIFDNKEGKEIKLSDSSPFPIVPSYKFNTISEVVQKIKTMTSQEEGYVVKLSDGSRIKLKSEEYLNVARIVSRMSPLVLWESMENGKVSKSLMETIPEEFRDVYEDYRVKLEDMYIDCKSACYNRYLEVMKAIKPEDDNISKAIGLYLKDNPDELNQTVFLILKDKLDNLDTFIMQQIKPSGNIL